MKLSLELKKITEQKLGGTLSSVEHVSGGSINTTLKIVTAKGLYFCKINSASKFPQLFQKEASGLSAIAEKNIIKVPKLIHLFETEDIQVLILEWINEGERTENFWETFGEQLACLHSVSNNEFGWREDNYMGAVPQKNDFSNEWTEFYKNRRLVPIIQKCNSKGTLSSKHTILFEKLFQQLPNIFGEQKPSFVHGDLWGGNFMCNENGTAVLIDPAVYFGIPAVDLGMTTLFGGFSKHLYETYNYYKPFPYNYKEQWEVCNLYPLLIHLHLFGRTYLSQIESTLKRFS